MSLTPTNSPKPSGTVGNVAVTPMAVPPRQINLFLRRALIEFPQRQPSADSLGEVEADDHHRYYIKGDAHGRLVRASEWISTCISEAVGIGAPTPVAIERIDGSTVFGSRRIAGVADGATTAAYLITPSLSNASGPLPGLSAILSSIYALDMFINNDDRHLGNYLSIDDNGTRRLYAFDFSRALFWDWPWQGFPAKGTNTRKCGALLRNFHGFDQGSALTTVDRLAGLTPAAIEGFINSMPSDWLPAAVRDQYNHWWTDGLRDTRLKELRSGIIDGTIL